MFEMSRLRVNQKTCRHCERGTLGRIRQSGNAERPADPHRTAENARRKIGQSRELTAAAT